MNRNDLIKAAKELNAVMELDPAIVVTTKAKDADIKAGITKASKLITEDDEFSEKTMAVLEEMGLIDVAEEEDEEDEDVEDVEEEEEDEDVEEEEDEEDDEEEDEEEEEEEEEAPAPKKGKKGKKGKTEDAPPPPKKKGKKGKTEDAPPPPKKKKVGITRLDAVCMALNAKKAPKTVDAWVEAADEIYAEAGGKANAKETRDDVRRVSKMAPHFEIEIPSK